MPTIFCPGCLQTVNVIHQDGEHVVEEHRLLDGLPCETSGYPTAEVHSLR